MQTSPAHSASSCTAPASKFTRSPTHPALPHSLPAWPSAGLQLLGKVDEKFVEVVDVFEPLEDGTRDKAFISKVGGWGVD